MARNKVDDCMFCGNSPCACGKPQPKPKATKKTEDRPPAEPKKIARIPSPPPRTQPPVAEVEVRKPPDMRHIKSVRPDVDPTLVAALTALTDVGLLHPDEIRKHRDLIDLPDVRIRAVLWRAENKATVTRKMQERG